MSEITIFTDGASRGNPGPGGWGAIVVVQDASTEKVFEIGGRQLDTTNNRMEIQAALGALSFLNEKNLTGPITLYTDSAYVLRGATQWLSLWVENNWHTAAKKKVLNRDVWEKMSAAIRGKDIEWKLLSGHVGVVGNERADKIATTFADGAIPKLFSGSLTDYGADILNIGYNAGQKEKRSGDKGRSRAKAYSYVSKVGGKILIHKTWEECEKRVKGVGGALFKKSLSSEDEKEIVKEFEKR